MALVKVLYIYYILYFKKDINKIVAFLDFGRQINAIPPVYIFKLGLKVYHTNIEAYKIDYLTLKILKITLASFQIENKLEKA